MSGMRRSIRGVMELFNPINKAKNGDGGMLEDGAHGKYLEDLTLEMEDSELVDLSKQWDDEYMEYEKGLKVKQDMNESFWLGIQDDQALYDDTSKDNLIFEAVETFLPLITKVNAEPLVYADNSTAGNTLCDNVKNMLTYQMDRLVLRQKIRKQARYWNLSYLGVLQMTWDPDADDIGIDVVKTQMIKLDPNGFIDERGVFHGEWIKKKVKTTAGKLAKKFPEHAEYIAAQAKDKMGTSIIYQECWTREYLFFQLKDKILLKVLNPHFNYETITEVNDETGEETEITQPGRNHFEQPQFPHIFLTVYNMGTQPHDVTNKLEQNIPQQRRINRRNNQLDQNIESMNNGIAVSGDFFTKEQAAESAKARRKGNPFFVPKGDVRKAFMDLPAQGLPTDVYNNLQDSRQELKNIFGISGSSSDELQKDSAVRNNIMAREFDASENSFPIEAIEQVYDRCFNWMVQMFMVYYDEAKEGSIIGKNNARTTIMLRSADIDRKISVSVREGSLIPKDSMSQANQAIDMFKSGALDPLTMYEKLEYPDPMATTKRLIAWKTNPIMLLQPDVNTAIPLDPNATADQTPPQDEGQGDTGAVDNSPEAVDITSIPIQTI